MSLRVILAIGLALCVPACVSDDDWERSRSYQNCATISVPGYSPPEVQARVIDRIKPYFAGREGVVSFSSLAKPDEGDVCVTWIGMNGQRADEILTDTIYEIRGELPSAVTSVKIN